MNKTQTERAIEVAVVDFRMDLQSALCKTDLDLYIQVRGVDMPIFVELQKNESVVFSAKTNEGLSCNKTNFYTNLEFSQTTISLNTLSDAEWIASK